MDRNPIAPYSRILITGGAGFVGEHLIRALNRKADIRVLDDLSTGDADVPERLHAGLRVGSILDRKMLKEAVRDVDLVFHLAAVANVEQSIHDPCHCHEVNATGTLRVLGAAAAAGVRRVIFASSAAVYGNHAEIPQREDMEPRPDSPYGITKLMGEHYCRYFRDTGRLETVALRFFNVFGKIRGSKAPSTVVEGFMIKALEGEPLVIHGDGEQTRDFIHAEDVARAACHAAELTEPKAVYNVGAGSSIAIRRLAECIVKLSASDSEIVHRPRRTGDVRYSLACMEALRRTGFRPQSDLENGLRTTLGLLRGRMTGPFPAGK